MLGVERVGDPLLRPPRGDGRYGRVGIGLLGLFLIASSGAAQPFPDGFFDELEFRHVGPAGNRVPTVVGVPGDPKVYYAGSASGGIFKTENGGTTWRAIFDDTPASSIGSLAVAPSDPNVVWAGTGEAFIRSNVSIGDGIYRSTDGGKTWENRGLEKSGRIGRVVIDPRDADVVYAAALGHLYGDQEERGVYRTRDGGETWERVLFVDPSTGAVDVVMDPNNPRILFAATWQMVMSTAGRTSGGPGSGIFVTRDGGDTWARLEGAGLPRPPWGKIGLAMSAADSSRVYALIETSSNRDFAPVGEFQGVLWRSDDGGESWKMVNRDNTLTQRPLYYTRAVAAPDDANEITFLATQQSISHDGGKTIAKQNSGYDHHDLWIDPLDPDRRVAGHDGGVSISLDRGATWRRIQLPNAQIYRVATDDRVPYFVYGNRQDGPTARGPSNSLDGDEIPIGAWQTVGGCEVGFSIPDPADPNGVWSGCYDGMLERHDLESGQSRDVSIWPLAIESWPGEDLDYRIQWTAPLAVSPHQPGTAYYGSQYVHRSNDGGQSWQRISPDLTTDDPELQRRTGGLTLDDAGPTIGAVVFSIAESPLEPGVIWAGTNDGLVQVTRDGGETWTNVTAGLRGLPPRGTVSNVEPSRHAPGRAYLTIDRHQEGDTDTYVYRTDDYGATWTRLGSDLPRSVFGYAHCVREDPVTAELLFLGTENALWTSFDAGKSWTSLQSNLPPAPVYWLTVQERFADLVVATYGRGFWILDDVTPLRQIATAPDGENGPRLFPPRDAWRFRRRAEQWSEVGSPAAGTNPGYGAILSYHLPKKVEGALTLVVRDATGVEVRRLTELDNEAGLHRTIWNLRGERSPEIRLRTRPDENPNLPPPDKGWRPLSDGGRFTRLQPAGSYTIELALDGEVLDSGELTVHLDPLTTADADELAAQTELLIALEDRIATAAETINEMESVRRQLLDLEDAWGRIEPGEATELAAEAKRLERAVAAEESVFFDLRLTGARQDTLRWKRLLYARLTYLARRVARSDHRPTDAQRAVFEELDRQLAAATGSWSAFQTGELAALNRRATEAGLGVVSW